MVKLHTFKKTQNFQSKTSTKPSEKNADLTALLRITQIVACGGDIDIIKVIGEHECSKFPQSLFTSDGQMRNPGTKAAIVQTLLKESGITPATELTNDAVKTTLVVDAMYAIRKWSFQKGDTYEAIANRYKANLLEDVPSGTTSIHFCCDRYKDMSLKESARQNRAGVKSLKAYEVMDSFVAPEPADFFAMSENNARLQKYLCHKWCNEPMEYGMTLFLAGGFADETKTVQVSDRDVKLVPCLQCTHEEADQRLLLHVLFTAYQVDVDRTVIYCSDTDVVCLAVHYASSRNLQNVWIQREGNYLPVHEMAQRLDGNLCKMLPFLHSIGGRDTTGFLYGIGKGSWVSASKDMNRKK